MARAKAVRVSSGSRIPSSHSLALAADGTIVDLGCGHGVLANYLALRSPGRRVLGFDLDEHRVAVAQSIGLPNAEFHCQDLFEAEPTRCDVMVVADVLHHLESREAGEELLARCCERLPADGQNLQVRYLSPQLGHELGGVLISRCLTGDDQHRAGSRHQLPLRILSSWSVTRE